MRRTCWAVCLLALGFITLSPVGAGDRESNREAKPGQFVAPDPHKGAGGTCAGAIPLNIVPALPLTIQGNNCSGTTNVSNYQNATCNTVAYPGPEVVYELELGPGNDLNVDLTPPSTADLGLFLVSDCDSPTSCVDFHDAIGPGVGSQIPRLQFGSYPIGTYYLFVDSYYATGPLSCGDYSLQIVCDFPVELLRFTIE